MYRSISPFSSRLAAYELPLKSRGFSTRNNDPKGTKQPTIRVSGASLDPTIIPGMIEVPPPGRTCLRGAGGGSNSLGQRHDLILYLRTYNLLAMETSLFAFATDLHDEGLETVLGNLHDRAGVDGLTMAVAYHDARDLFPHNPVHKVRYLEGGAVFFFTG